MVELQWGAATDTGRVRGANEDSVLAIAQVFAVADGMGGHAAGEIASSVALDALRDAIVDRRVTVAVVIDAVRAANEAVFRRSMAEPSARGMGTTLTLIAPAAGDDQLDHLVVANVGDSRAYLFADGQLRQLTRDHSYVEEMLAAGQITADEARSHPHRHVVTRALGVEPSVAVDTWLVTPEPGDRFLICSDGLINEVPDEEIAATLMRTADPQAAAVALVAAANAAGGRDNISVVVVDVVQATGRGPNTARVGAVDPSAIRAEGAQQLGGWLTEEMATGFDQPVPPASTASTGATATTAGATSAKPQGATPTSPTARKRRRITTKTVIFTTLVLAVFVAAFAGIAAFGRSGYYVGFEGNEVAVYQGRPGGVLWFHPTVESVSTLARDAFTPEYQARIQRNPTFSSRAAADRYVEALSANADAFVTTTTTSSPTTVVASTSSTVVSPSVVSAPPTTLGP